MNKKFRCGRLIITKDGKKKVIKQSDGGGARVCNWDNQNMDLNEAHQKILKLFGLNERDQNTFLYDYQKELLNIEKYGTVKEYFDRHGLNPISTVMFLTTYEVDPGRLPDKMIVKPEENDVIITSIPSTQDTSSRSQNTLSTENVSEENERKHSIKEEIHPSSSTFTFLEYSFEKSINELMTNVRHMIDQNNFDKKLNQIYDNICIINGRASRIDELNKLIQQSNQYSKSLNQNEIKIYKSSLKHACNMAESINISFEKIKEKYRHMTIFSTINDLFEQLFNNLEKLKNQLIQHHKDNSDKISALSTVESSSTNIDEDKDKDEKFALFRRLLSCLDNLLHLTRPDHLSSFHSFVLTSIDQIKSLRSRINLHDDQSVYDGKQAILVIKNELTKILDEQDNRSRNRLNKQLNLVCHRTLRAIRFLSTELYRYQMKIGEKHQENNSKWSPIGKRKFQGRSSIQPKRHKRNYNNRRH